MRVTFGAKIKSTILVSYLRLRTYCCCWVDIYNLIGLSRCQMQYAMLLGNFYRVSSFFCLMQHEIETYWHRKLYTLIHVGSPPPLPQTFSDCLRIYAPQSTLVSLPITASCSVNVYFNDTNSTILLFTLGALSNL